MQPKDKDKTNIKCKTIYNNVDKIMFHRLKSVNANFNKKIDNIKERLDNLNIRLDDIEEESQFKTNYKTCNMILHRCASVSILTICSTLMYVLIVDHIMN